MLKYIGIAIVVVLVVGYLLLNLTIFKKSSEVAKNYSSTKTDPEANFKRNTRQIDAGAYLFEMLPNGNIKVTNSDYKIVFEMPADMVVNVTGGSSSNDKPGEIVNRNLAIHSNYSRKYYASPIISFVVLPDPTGIYVDSRRDLIGATPAKLASLEALRFTSEDGGETIIAKGKGYSFSLELNLKPILINDDKPLTGDDITTGKAAFELIKATFQYTGN
ncbi:MAG: hypothetical protein G01um10147_566 [Microgenomates group bacterium Gr01-1014_7]|nr:MAG: hypothetical protein G01um10147_566 [Microgenomates group bacterium Gr01-1014_7]